VSRLIVHAGLSKSGSSTVQEWVEDNTDLLRANGVRPMVVHLTRRGRVRVSPLRSQAFTSGSFVRAYSVGRDPALLGQLVDALTDALEGAETIFISCEGFGGLIANGDEAFLRAHESLGRSGRVEVAYYVRPQHTSLESAWRQWGFRSGSSPSTYLDRRARRLHYREMLDLARRLAPSVEFLVRPFRADLLDGESVVVDFAGRLLGGDEPATEPVTYWSNRGLPLDLVNLLQQAPPGTFSERRSDARYLALRAWAARHEFDDADRVRLSRLVLQQWCRDTFERGNMQLADRVAWPITDFVPPLDDADRALLDGHEISLVAFDDLWRPTASAAEQAWMFAALDEVLPSPSRWGSRARRGAMRLAPGPLRRRLRRARPEWVPRQG
jgi:hypothetical protein